MIFASVCWLAKFHPRSVVPPKIVFNRSMCVSTHERRWWPDSFFHAILPPSTPDLFKQLVPKHLSSRRIFFNCCSTTYRYRRYSPRLGYRIKSLFKRISANSIPLTNILLCSIAALDISARFFFFVYHACAFSTHLRQKYLIPLNQ